MPRGKFNGRARRFKMVSDRVADSRSAAFEAFRSKASASKRAVSRPSFVRQLKALVGSKKRDAPTVLRDFGPSAGGAQATTISCLTSTTNFAVAPSGTGLLNMDGDECYINSVQIRGQIDNGAIVDVDRGGSTDTIIRNLVVWFNKPLILPSTGGTLPPISEVLEQDTPYSLVISDAINGGRFRILSDRSFKMGMNTMASAGAATYPIGTGQNIQIYDYTVKVNKSVKFKALGVSGTPSGHYDSDVPAGQVDAGLLILYSLYTTGDITGSNVGHFVQTRLNYTG